MERTLLAGHTDPRVHCATLQGRTLKEVILGRGKPRLRGQSRYLASLSRPLATWFVLAATPLTLVFPGEEDEVSVTINREDGSKNLVRKM